MITKDLTKLQERMDALAGVKCPACEGDGVITHPDGNEREPISCPDCNGTGLDPRYDVLREKCRGIDEEDVGVYYHDNCCDNKKYRTLPAERCHEAVGKLLHQEWINWYELSGYTGDHRIRIQCKVEYGATPFTFHTGKGDTPEEALVAALYEAEFVE